MRRAGREIGNVLSHSRRLFSSRPRDRRRRPRNARTSRASSRAYHDRLFSEPGKLSDADLKHAPAALGMDSPRFNKCVDGHTYRSVVDADAKAGCDAGVTGTTAFFINGQLLSRAQPYGAFKHVIDEELEFKKR